MILLLAAVIVGLIGAWLQKSLACLAIALFALSFFVAKV